MDPLFIGLLDPDPYSWSVDRMKYEDPNYFFKTSKRFRRKKISNFNNFKIYYLFNNLCFQWPQLWSFPSDNLQVVRTFNYAANNNNFEQLPERETEQLIDVNIYHSLFVSLSRQIISYNCSIKIRQSYIFMGKNVIYSRVGIGITILKREAGIKSSFSVESASTFLSIDERERFLPRSLLA